MTIFNILTEMQKKSLADQVRKHKKAMTKSPWKRSFPSNRITGIVHRLTDEETQDILAQLMIPEFKKDTFYTDLSKSIKACQ